MVTNPMFVPNAISVVSLADYQPLKQSLPGSKTAQYSVYSWSQNRSQSVTQRPVTIQYP